MLTVQTPNNYKPERGYILSVILDDFLGLEYNHHCEDRRDTRITTEDGRELIVADGLFSVSDRFWLKPGSLPMTPLKLWEPGGTPLGLGTVNNKLPVIYGENPEDTGFFTRSKDKIHLGLDVFGSAFFMLTLYEEVIKADRDPRNRFPYTASLAFRSGFLDRPIVNEYVEILWACLSHLWPGLRRKQRQFQIYASHDVDAPFLWATAGITRLVKECIFAVTRSHSPSLLVNNVLEWTKIKAKGEKRDPYNTFNRIMDISEKHNLKSAFYFIAGNTAGGLDGDYRMEHPLILKLLRNIHRRGHEIGLHLSYNTFEDAVQTKKEFQHLKKVCASQGIEQERWGSRQHFLRWKTPVTFQYVSDAGLDYDTTVSFADTPGFRCGVCYEFPVFNVLTRQKLPVIERPLVVMDCTVTGARCMRPDMDVQKAINTILNYRNQCKRYHGNFTILWHNNRFVNEQEVEIYRQSIA